MRPITLLRRLGALVLVSITTFGAVLLVGFGAIVITGCLLACTRPNPWGWLLVAAGVVVFVAGMAGGARLVDARHWVARAIVTTLALVVVGLVAHRVVAGAVAAVVVLWAPVPMVTRPTREATAGEHAR